MVKAAMHDCVVQNLMWLETMFHPTTNIIAAQRYLFLDSRHEAYRDDPP